ncbi:MAG TPA: hemolysin family protein [Syntrophales bacterium]|mgnify:CR=1 FL=1|nr:hemolysin family protein [Syntrophales bacterium]
MTLEQIFILAIIAACVLLQGLFSGGEIALVSSNIHKLRQKARRGSRAAGMVLELREKPHLFLSMAPIGTNLCEVTASTGATLLFISLFGPLRGEWLAVGIMIPVLLLFGEVIPKSICQARPEKSAQRLSWFFRGASWLLAPLVFVVSRLTLRVVLLLTGKTDLSYSPYITRDALVSLISSGSDGDTDILRSEKDMVRRVFDFSGTTAGEIMVPLSAMTALPVTATLEDAVRLVREQGFLRIPVYRDQVLNIVGILDTFDLLACVQPDRRNQDEPAESVQGCLKTDVLYIPDTMPAKDLLLEMKTRGERMAAVVDEYGGVVGIVTLEDILEEVVGEIHDEYDTGEKLFRRLGPGHYLFNARISIERIRTILPMEFPEGDYETLGGFLLARMGRIPKKRDTFPIGPVIFIVEDAGERAVREVAARFSPELERLAGDGGGGGGSWSVEKT